MVKVKDVLLKATKDYGDKVATIGGDIEDTRRIPTGIYQFDYATGGGFPRGLMSMVWGKESSGKTNLVLRSAAMAQLIEPEKHVVLMDIEHTYDPKWGKRLGVIHDRAVVVRPDTGEQAVNILVDFIYAKDVSLIMVDSIAAIIGQKEIDKDAETMQVAGSSLIVGGMVRKVTRALLNQGKEGHDPAVVFINQIRHKIGQMYGDPESTPGGNALRFAIALGVRLYGKDVIKKHVNPTLSCAKNTDFTVRKYKIPVAAIAGTYEMAMIPHDGLKVGESDAWNTLSSRMKDFGLIEQLDKNKGWKIEGEVYKTLKEYRELLAADPIKDNEMKQRVIRLAVAQAQGDEDG